VDGEATGRDKKEEKKKKEEKERERKKGREIEKRGNKKELFYLFLEIMIHKFYFVYYYYIMKIEYDNYIK
jgi:hypothetical protein